MRRHGRSGNRETRELEAVHGEEVEKVESEEDRGELLELLGLQRDLANSSTARKLIENWPDCLEHFVKVMPTDYKRVLMERRKHDEEIEADVAAFS